MLFPKKELDLSTPKVMGVLNLTPDSFFDGGKFLKKDNTFDESKVFNSIESMIEDGADFGDVAREHSDDHTSANLGGDMGWFQVGAYGERVEQMLAGLEIGEVSEPFQSSVGWHIIERLGEREVDVTEDAMRARARESIRQSKANAEVDRYLRQMREEAFVESRLES